MKNTVLTLLLLIISANCLTSQPRKTDYVEIKRVGHQPALTKPLFISNEAVNITLKGDRLKINDQESILSDVSDEVILSKGLYAVLLTDDKTLKEIMAFIHQHHELLNQTNEPKTRDIDYCAIVNGRTYDISSKIEVDFFSKMILFLKAENCDQNSIAALNSDLITICNLNLGQPTGLPR